jgi:hypothetical protein
MKTKIICIFVMALLITVTLPAMGVNIRNVGNENPPALPNNGVDQEQTNDSNWGQALCRPYWLAQSFKPSKENLTSVQLFLFKYGDPPAGTEITVSIKNALNGTDLTAKTVNADKIKKAGTWVLFDFENIIVIPEKTYYIVCYSNQGTLQDTYCWIFGLINPYTRGESWYSNSNGNSWITLWEAFGFDPEREEPDFCFKTYHKTSRDKTINRPFFNIMHRFLEIHPNMFPILRQLLGL